MADFTGVTNPKRVVNRRLNEAGEGDAAAPAEPSGNMSQAQFTAGRKRSPMEEAVRQRKLVDKLRSSGHQDFQPSGGY